MRRYALITAFLIIIAFQTSCTQPEDRENGQQKPTNTNKNASSYKQGTDGRPFVVKTIPGPITKNSAKNEAYQANKKPLYDLVGAITTIWIAAITTALAIFNVFLWYATKKAANAAHRSADAIVRIESPIIRVFSAPLVSLYESTSVQGVSSQSLYVHGLKFVNYGRTPAFPERLDTGWMVIDKLPTMPVYTNSNDLSTSGPIITETFDMTETSESIEPTADQWEKISKKTRLWYYGCFYYRNFMNDRQEFRFCWGLFNAGMTGQKPVYSFLSYGDIPKAYTKNT